MSTIEHVRREAERLTQACEAMMTQVVASERAPSRRRRKTAAAGIRGEIAKTRGARH